MSQVADESTTLRPFTVRSRPSPLAWAARQVVTSQLERIHDGEVTLTDGTWSKRFGRITSDSPLRARVNVHNRRAFQRLLTGGTIGGAEAYAHGEWAADDLTALVRIFARNHTMVAQLDSRLGRWLQPAHRLFHRLRANTVEGSRENIAAHYDLGNDFFQTFLDATMSYSCGIYPTPDASLEQASRFKIDVLCRKLSLRATDDVLEIGTGWGALAVHAAATYGCRVTTTTISKEQFALASERVQRAGLSDRVSVINVDYRHLPTLDRRFDKLISVEMVEAVGEPFLPTFFEICGALLKPAGLMALQSIVIADELFQDYRRSVDFIQRYIFPGGFLPSRRLLHQLAARGTGAEVVQTEDFTAHYARTLADWRRAFLTSERTLRALGYPQHLLRLWDYYFSYCEGGFLERTIGVVQMVLARPQASPILFSTKAATW